MELNKKEEAGTGVLCVVGNTLDGYRFSIATRTTEELKSELARLIGFTAENMTKVALVVYELEKRGEDLSGLRLGILPYLRKIAAGTLLAEVVVKFAASPNTLRIVMSLPIHQQQGILDGTVALPGLSPPRLKRGGSHPPGWTLAAMAAAKGAPRDVGAMAAELVAMCSEPQVAFDELAKCLAKNRVVGRAAIQKAVEALSAGDNKQESDDAEVCCVCFKKPMVSYYDRKGLYPLCDNPACETKLKEEYGEIADMQW